MNTIENKLAEMIQTCPSIAAELTKALEFERSGDSAASMTVLYNLLDDAGKDKALRFAKTMQRKHNFNVAAAIDKLTDRCNLIGISCDVYREMNRYKALREADEATRDYAYDCVVAALGF